MILFFSPWYVTHNLILYVVKSMWMPEHYIRPCDCWTCCSKIMGLAMGTVSDFPPDFWTWLHGFAPIQPQENYSEVGHLGLTHCREFYFIPNVLEGVEVRALCRPLKFSPKPNWEYCFLMDLALCLGHCHVETGKGSSPNCCHRVRRTLLSYIIECCSIKTSFHWSKEASTKPWKLYTKSSKSI